MVLQKKKYIIRITNKENHSMLSGLKMLQVLGRDTTHAIVKQKLLNVHDETNESFLGDNATPHIECRL